MTAPTLTPPVPPQPQTTQRWGVGRVLAIVASSLLLLLGVGLLVGAGGVQLADSVLRDDAGYVSSDATSWTSPGYAARSERLDLRRGPLSFDLPHRMIGDVRVTADPTGADGVFVGIGRTADVNRYLRGVAHSTVHDPFDPDGSADPTFVDGGSPRVAPTEAGFWAAASTGTTTQSLVWEPEPGTWTLVVMNREGTTPVAADVTVGAELPMLGTTAAVLLVAGLVTMGVGGLGLWLAVRAR